MKYHNVYYLQRNIYWMSRMYASMYAHLLSCVWLFGTLWTVAHQTPLSMGFPRQECWSGLPFLPPGDLPDPGINLSLLNLLYSLPLNHLENPIQNIYVLKIKSTEDWRREWLVTGEKGRSSPSPLDTPQDTQHFWINDLKNQMDNHRWKKLNYSFYPQAGIRWFITTMKECFTRLLKPIIIFF